MFSTSKGLLLPRDDDDDPEDVDATLEVLPTSVSSAVADGEVLRCDDDSPESTSREDGWPSTVRIPDEEVADALLTSSDVEDC